MTQYARPLAIVDAGGWTGAVSDVNEATPNDATYVESPETPTESDVLVLSLGPVTDPASSTDHVARARVAKGPASSDRLDYKLDVVQTSTVIATSGWHLDIPASPVTQVDVTLTTDEANAITDYGALRLHHRFRQGSTVLRSGESYTFGGTGFGTKTTARPWHWDDFSIGPHGTTPDGRTGRLGGQAYVQYNTTHRDNPARTQFYGYSDGTGRAGKRSFRKTGTGDNFASSYLTGINAREVFATWWFRLKLDSGTGDEAINKLMRFNVGAAYTGTPSILMVANGVTTSGWRNVRFSQDDGAGGGISQSYLNAEHGPAIDNTGTVWYRFEVYLKLSTPGVVDGAVVAGILGSPYYEDETVATCGATVAGDVVIAHVFAPEMQLANGGDAPLYLTLDACDVYVDTTRQRVELGDAATWAGCTVREVQPASAWADDSITILGNPASIGAGTAYLYVIGSDGQPTDTDGIAVTVEV